MFDFKRLIDALLRKGREENYTGPSVTIMMVEMPRGDSLAALTEIVKAIAALNRDAAIALKERHRSVLGFDEKARPLIATLVNVYLGREHIEGIGPRNILPVLVNCWHEFGAAYRICLKQHARNPSSRFAPHTELITLRAVGYYALEAKWSYLRYFETDTKVWRDLNQLYRYADSNGFAAKPQVRYPEEAPSSVADHYLRAALLKLAEPERQRPEDVWQIDEWLATRLDSVKIEKFIRPRDQNFAINIQEAKPPMKLRRNMLGDQYRYLATDALANRFAMEAESYHLGASDAPGAQRVELPPEAALLADLALVFSREGQVRARRSERSTSGRDVQSVVSLPAALKFVKGDAVAVDVWSLVDESANGLGANYRARYDDKLVVDELVAMRDQDKHIILNVVRRLTKTREGVVRVGAERVAAQPVAVTLISGTNEVKALFCNVTSYGPRALIIENLNWKQTDEVTLVSGSKRYGIKIGPILEQFPHLIVVGFTVHAKQ